MTDCSLPSVDGVNISHVALLMQRNVIKLHIDKYSKILICSSSFPLKYLLLPLLSLLVKNAVISSKESGPCLSIAVSLSLSLSLSHTHTHESTCATTVMAVGFWFGCYVRNVACFCIIVVFFLCVTVGWGGRWQRPLCHRRRNSIVFCCSASFAAAGFRLSGCRPLAIWHIA